MNKQVVRLLAAHGVKFKYEIEIAVGVFQVLAVAYDVMMIKNELGSKAIMDILVNGIANEIVEE